MYQNKIESANSPADPACYHADEGLEDAVMQQETQTNRAVGRCFCGAVAFAIEFPTNWVVHCHCPTCRFSQAAAFTTWVSVDASRAIIQASRRVLRWYNQSDHAQRGFCSRCGSSLFFRSENYPDELHIALASFLTPIDRKPKLHAYYDQHVDWFEPNDDLPKQSSRSQPGPAPQIAHEEPAEAVQK
jgi:hypothetical protein